MTLAFILATVCVLAVQAQTSKEKCDISSPGMLALEILASDLEKHTVHEFEMKFKQKHSVSLSPPPEFSPEEVQEIGKQVVANWCDYKQSHCSGGNCLKPDCQSEHEKLFQIFKTCAKNLKSRDFASIFGYKDHGLHQFINEAIVLARKYFWSGDDRAVFGNTYWTLFELLVPLKYREAIKGSDFPLSIGKEHGNINNKKAATTCLLIARGEDVTKGLAEYQKEGYSKISNDLVEEVFISLLSGSIADRVLDDKAVKTIGARKSYYSKKSMWKVLGKRLKSIDDLPLCMDPIRAAINELKVTCQLKNIAFGSNDLTDVGSNLANILPPHGISIVRPMILPLQPPVLPTIIGPGPAVEPVVPVNLGGHHGPLPPKIPIVGVTPPINSKYATTTVAPKRTMARQTSTTAGIVYAGYSAAPSYQSSNSNAAPQYAVPVAGPPSQVRYSGGAPLLRK